MNIQQMMKQAKKMQEKITKSKMELSQKEFVIKKQGVNVTILGNRKIKAINLDDALIDPDDKELLQDIIILAINEANELIDAAEDLLEQPSNSGVMF